MRRVPALRCLEAEGRRQEAGGGRWHLAQVADGLPQLVLQHVELAAVAVDVGVRRVERDGSLEVGMRLQPYVLWAATVNNVGCNRT